MADIETDDRQGIKMDPTDDAHLTTHRPPDFSSQTPYQTPIGDFSSNSIRMKGLVDEVGAFVRSGRNARKAAGQ